MHNGRGTNVLMVGVGGQGIILASRILASVVQKHGFDLKMSEIHGMAQRGGSVVTHVRFGEKVYSPLIEMGQADFIFALEKLEAWRYLPFLRPQGTIVANTQEIKPVPVIIGAQKYPEGIVDSLHRLVGEKIGAFYGMNALDAARSCGQARAANVVLCGVLARCLEFPLSSYLDVIKDSVPARFLEENINAFRAGYDYFPR